jgi:IclR family KDG regulon transcriptional repressor
MTESIRSVDRALDILLVFRLERPSLSLTQIADEVGMNKSTVYRLLGTLEKKHFINRDTTTGHYHLGMPILEMATVIQNDSDIWRFAQPYLEMLSSECGETVDLSILEDNQVRYIQVVESHQRVKLAASVGQRLPLYCTASGKAFLAYMPEEFLKKIFPHGLTRHTANTIVEMDDLLKDLIQTRKRGFSISLGEYENDIHALAAPILNSKGQPLAVIAIAGPAFRLPLDRMRKLGGNLLETNQKIAFETGLDQSTKDIITSRREYKTKIEEMRYANDPNPIC